MEALRQHVDQEAPDELVGRQRHRFVAGGPLGPIVLVLEGDAVLVGGQQPAIGDRDAVGVARQIAQHPPGPGERLLRVDHGATVSACIAKRLAPFANGKATRSFSPAPATMQAPRPPRLPAPSRVFPPRAGLSGSQATQKRAILPEDAGCGPCIRMMSGCVSRALEPNAMIYPSCRSALALLVAPALALASSAQAVDIWTVGVDNTRQGWNRSETVLKAANVPRLKKIRDFPVDEKIDVSPLVVGDKLYVFTLTNTAYVFDVNTGAELVKRQLAAPFDPADIANPPKKGMDLHNMYRNWGITATPGHDVATNTLYVTTFGKPNAASQNTERDNMLWILDANTLTDKKPPVLIAGDADNGVGGIANGFTTPYQKMRAGLGLLTEAGGNKAVVVSFSINGENPNGQ